jgi:hypothetical protein
VTPWSSQVHSFGPERGDIERDGEVTSMEIEIIEDGAYGNEAA